MPKLYFSATMKLALCAAALLFLWTGAARAQIVKSGSFQAASDGENVTLRWITDDESNVARFRIERRTSTEGAFTSIATVDPKGASLYEYIDYSAFRKVVTVYQYRVKIEFSNGSAPVMIGPLTVSHTVSGVRRTWGSIKALFR